MKQQSFDKNDLIRCSQGALFGEGNAQLPASKMLMLDRITHISNEGGTFNKGVVIAELDLHKDLWFFDCHFIGDPVMPGCLGLDALWQLLGFYLGWSGNLGRGRALGCSDVKFSGQILPTNKKVSYYVNIRRIISRNSVALGIANGVISVDDKEIYTANGLRVGLFQNTDSF